MGSKLLYPSLWTGCVGAWAPSQDRSRSTLLTDHSGYGNHGTLTNIDPATDWVASEGKMALDFDGSDDYAVMPNVSSTFVAKVFSVSLWINTTATTTNNFAMTFASSADGVTFAGVGSGASVASRPRYIMRDSGSSIIDIEPSGYTINSGLWNHVLVTVNSSTSTLWFNGVVAGSGTTPANSFPSDRVTIGALGRGGYSNFLAFKMDDLRIYNRALTPSESALLATRRGIAYERRRTVTAFVGSGSPPPTPNRRNNMLVGMGF